MDESQYIDKAYGKGGFILGDSAFDETLHGFPRDRLMRWGTVLDCRGKLRIASTARLGWQVMILTASHEYTKDGMGRRILRTVLIDDYAWVCSRALLYNCHVQEHAIVGAGAVVKNVVVPAWSLVEGNPAVMVGRFDTEKGRYVKFNNYIEEMEKF